MATFRDLRIQILKWNYIQKYFSRLGFYEFELRIHKRARREFLVPFPETSKTADMERNSIPITQIDDEVVVIGEDRLNSNL
jgi:hypothetical protein